MMGILALLAGLFGSASPQVGVAVCRFRCTTLASADRRSSLFGGLSIGDNMVSRLSSEITSV